MSMEPFVEPYLAGLETLRQAVAGMTREQAMARPVPGKWSTHQVVCHLADFEAVYADRMKRVLAEDQPLLLSADEQKYAEALHYEERDMEEELALIDLTRRQMARILRQHPVQALARAGIYRHDGLDEPRTLEQFLGLITKHIPHHVKFVVEKRRALGLKG